MTVALSLETMTVAEELEMMQRLWADLSHNARNIPAPAWHRLKLLKRHEAIEKGASKFSDWENGERRTLKSVLQKSSD